MEIERNKYSCKFPNCTNNYVVGAANKRFLRFPTRFPSVCIKWEEFCNMLPGSSTKSFRLCEEHFQSTDFWTSNMNRLKYGVIPSLPAYSAQSPSATQKDGDHTYSLCEEESFETIIRECIAKETNLKENSYTFLENEIVETEEYLDGDFEGESGNLKQGILGVAGMNRQDLTPRKEEMYRIHRRTTSKLSKLKTCLHKEKEKVKSLKAIYDEGKFKLIEENLNSVTKEFIDSQFRNFERKPRAKRWTLQDKVFALSMYKRSPRLYRYLRNYFQLPSITTLKYLLSKVPFDVGINRDIMEHLKSKVGKMQELDRNCVLLLDEVSLSTGLHFEQHKSHISGYEDLGHLGRSERLADHALVFMVRGIRKSWKQVISYYFTANTISTEALKQIIVEVIEQLQNINLKVVATVCDQGSTNRAALNGLLRDTDPSSFYFKVNNEPICIIYDVPHLMKNTRNALLRCLCQFEQDKQADFEHIESAFNLDQQKRTFKMLPKLRRDHFNFKDSRVKMKVKVAANQLSYSVASCIETWISSGDLPSNAAATAAFVHKVDSLFDSLNGYSFMTPEGKPLKGVLKSGSPHFLFWSEMLKDLRNWKLIDRYNGRDVTNQYHFIRGWQTTIRSIIYLWNSLEQKGFKYFSLRSFNQDPLENLFSVIRQHGAGNTNPTCHQFTAALKTVVINGLTSPVNNGNCEKDDCENLDNLCFFFQESAKSHSPMECNPNLVAPILTYTKESSGDELIGIEPLFEEVECEPSEIEEFDSLLDREIQEFPFESNKATPYVAGYILRKIQIPDCIKCNKEFFSDEPLDDHNFIMFKEFCSDKNKLIYPSVKVSKFLDEIHDKMYNFLDDNGHKTDLIELFKTNYGNSFSKFQFCSDHNIKEVLLHKAIRLIIFKYMKDKKEKVPSKRGRFKK